MNKKIMYLLAMMLLVLSGCAKTEIIETTGKMGEYINIGEAEFGISKITNPDNNTIRGDIVLINTSNNLMDIDKALTSLNLLFDDDSKIVKPCYFYPGEDLLLPNQKTEISFRCDALSKKLIYLQINGNFTYRLEKDIEISLPIRENEIILTPSNVISEKNINIDTLDLNFFERNSFQLQTIGTIPGINPEDLVFSGNTMTLTNNGDEKISFGVNKFQKISIYHDGTIKKGKLDLYSNKNNSESIIMTTGNIFTVNPHETKQFTIIYGETNESDEIHSEILQISFDEQNVIYIYV